MCCKGNVILQALAQSRAGLPNNTSAQDAIEERSHCLDKGSCVIAGNGVSQEQIRLIDDQTFETLDVLSLHRYEMACSCTSITLADDPSPYYVVGTAYAIPEEQEPTKVSTVLHHHVC